MSAQFSTADLAATEEGRAMLQERVASFGKATSLALLGFLAYRVTGELLFGDAVDLLKPDMLAHLAAGILLASMWGLCRSGTRSPGYVRTVETVGLVGASFAFEVMGTTINPYKAPEMIVLMALTFLLTGAHVFTAKTVVEMCSDHLHTQPVPPSERLGEQLPSGLEDLILDCLEKDPERRPQSAQAFQDALTSCGVPTWTKADAQHWWDRVGGEVSRRRDGRVVSAAGATIDIDFAARLQRG